MSNSIPPASRNTVLDWVGSRNFQLGRSYFEGNAIIDPQRQGSVVKGWCQGSMPQPYRLHVAFDAGGIDGADCSCPVGGGGHCKHVGALLLAWLERPDAFREVAELDAVLQQRSRDELIALIKRMLQIEPDLERLLEMALPEGDRKITPMNPEIYRRQVASAFQRGGDDWLAAQRVARDIGITLGYGDEFLARGDYAAASTVYQAVAQGVLEHYDMMLDEDGQLVRVVGECIAGLGNCLTAGGDDAQLRQNCLQTLFAIYRFDAELGGVVLGDGVPDLILEHAMDAEKGAIAGWVRAALPQGETRGDDYRRKKYGRFLLDLGLASLDDDAFLGICQECGLLAELVDRLLTLGRLDDAVAEADLAGDPDLRTVAEVFHKHGYARVVEPLLVKRVASGPNRRLAEWLKERYRERGELAEALALVKRMMEPRPHLADYLEVRELSRALGAWQEERLRLLDSWAAAGAYHLLTEVHLEEGEIDLALQSVRRGRQGTLYAADQLLRVARRRQQHVPTPPSTSTSST